MLENSLKRKASLKIVCVPPHASLLIGLALTKKLRNKKVALLF